MRESIDDKKIVLSPDLTISLYPIGDNAKIYEIDEAEAEEFGEAIIQIEESRRYEYSFTDPAYILSESNHELKKYAVIIPSKNKEKGGGNITPGNYVGTMSLVAIKGDKKIPFEIEVLATKLGNKKELDEGYRTNYRSMVESITEKCTELLMQANSPVHQNFEPNFKESTKTIYQRFSFVKSIVNSQEFEESLLKIFSSPKTAWQNKEESVDVRSIKRFTNKNVKELLKGTNRMPLPTSSSLYRKNKLESIPTKIASYKQEETLDTPENRFVKHSLTTYLWFCEKCIEIFKEDSKDQKEAKSLRNKLESFLNHTFFKTISRPTTLKLNSPTLQRKSGYRQVLKVWLMYDLATKLVWKGGEDVYEAGKRDIATLYEYWLFFVLYDLFNKKFEFDKLEQNDKPYDHLISLEKNGLNLIVKAGQHTALSGIVLIGNREMNVKYSFNRTFSGHKDSFPRRGSWTTSMRPDYSLSVWPKGKTESQAEEEEIILHIHFDAKYKVNNFVIQTNKKDIELSEEEQHAITESLNKQKEQERKGNYKNADLLKMHAYKDAIRRTGGAYILYPGTENMEFKGFHELIPGLGAFSLNPANEAKDVEALSIFIDKVIAHLINRASQRENIANKTYEVHKNDSPNVMKEPIPESFNNQKLIPDETFVLVGYAKSELREKRMDWFLEKGMYNFRMNEEKGSLKFTEKEAKAKFLIIRESTKNAISKIYKLKEGIRVFTGAKLQEMGHPKAEKDSYLVLDFEKDSEELKPFENTKWDFKKLNEDEFNISNEKFDINSGKPFTISLTQLMKLTVTE